MKINNNSEGDPALYQVMIKTIDGQMDTVIKEANQGKVNWQGINTIKGELQNLLNNPSIPLNVKTKLKGVLTEINHGTQNGTFTMENWFQAKNSVSSVTQ